MKRSARAVLVIAGVLLLAHDAAGQTVSMDRGVRAGGLWCFPLANDSTTYVYLPPSARLAQDDQGRPQFSFLRYVVNTAGDSSSNATITQARGGGILTFLVQLDTPRAAIDAAQRELRERVKNDSVTVRGPIVFADGRYTLVSSVLRKEGAPPAPEVLAVGRAPVLEGDKLALSFDLDPEHATLLMQSFTMSTPDVSLVFDMSFTGLSDAYDAEMSIDWSEVRSSKSFSAGGSVYWVGADVSAAFDDLFKNHAIQMRSSGTDASMEALMATVYNKLLELLFKPVEPQQVPESSRGSLMDAMSAMMGSKGEMGSRKTTGFGLGVGYQLKEMRSGGRSVLSFNHRANVERHSFVTFNIGDFYSRYGKDPRYFRAVNLADPTFQQREVQVAVDASLLPDFDRYVNAVTLTLRKDHSNGEQTVREVVLDRAATRGQAPRLVYGWNGDNDRIAWLDYQYRARWSFKGGGTFESAWLPTSAPMIDLFAPYEHRTVQLVGSAKTLKDRGVRAVIVQVEYPFFGEQRRPQMVVRPEDTIEDKQVEITLPLGQPEYDYTVTWQLDGNRRVTSKHRDSSGLIFIDELP